MKKIMKALRTFSHLCLRCDHDWVSRLKRPRVCPKCKSYSWDKPRPEAVAA